MKRRLGAIFLFSLTVVLYSCGTSSKTTQLDQEIADDGSWCWFSDPRAIYHKGSNERVYFGYVTSRGDIMAKSIDLKTNQTDEFVLHERLEIDDHDNPTFLVLPDGKLLAFYSHHNGDLFMRKTKKAEDITEWEPTRILLKKTNQDAYCYTNPIMLSGENNRIYLFGRNSSREKLNNRTATFTKLYFIYSDDYGATWSGKKVFLDNRDPSLRPYAKYASDKKSRIDILFTDGHPNQSPKISTYHIFYEKGIFKNTDGTIISSADKLPVSFNKIPKFYDAGQSGVRSWIWDIALDKNNHPAITYALYPSPLQHQYYYAKWNGKNWEDKKVAEGGPYITIIKPGQKLREHHYSGGIVLDHNNTDHIYLSRKVGEHFEIEKRIVRSNKNEVTAITKNSTVDNLRPYIVHGNAKHQPILMWLAGNYYHYTDYDTKLKIRK